MDTHFDMSLENNPYEVGLGWQVDFGHETGFLGREALARIKKEGPRRKLAGVEIAGDRLDLNTTRWPVRHREAAVGLVTSAVFSPRLERNIGYALVPATLAELGVELEVEVAADDVRRAKVVPRPFVDPDKKIPKE